MFAYCENNPVNYYDPSGKNAEAAIWIGAMGSTAMLEPTPVGEIIFLTGLLIFAGKWIVNQVSEWITTPSTYPNTEEDLTDTKPETDSTESEVDDNGYPVVKPKQQPTEKDGYKAPKGGPKWDKEKRGWKDKYGNTWKPVPTGSGEAHPSGHWDVEGPKGGYINVFPGGRTSGGQRPLPRLPMNIGGN